MALRNRSGGVQLATSPSPLQHTENNMAALPYYTYMHTRNDTGKPFYIGKGSARRAWDNRRSKRGAHWSNVASKHGYEVHILAQWKTEKEAHNHEVFLIDTMRNMGVDIVNKTIGGEGSSGYKWNDESRAKLSAIASRNNSGEKNPMFGRKHSAETRVKLSAAKVDVFTGSKHPKATIDEELAVKIKHAKGTATAKDVAKNLGVSWHVVRNIWSGKSWRNING
jgi:hypothetical protein